MHKRFVSILLCLFMLAATVLPVFAEEVETAEETPVEELVITSVEEFIIFSERCRLDSYSQNLVVSLEADIDLSGSPFVCIPIFSGTFEGNGKKITGLTITAEGSAMGLFRYLTATAVVQDLSVSGEIHPGGSQGEVGAIVGRNEGQIRNCRFFGSVSGRDYVGGIAGINAVTGVIEDCVVEGQIHGDHFVGGVVGENLGVIRKCINRAPVNTTPQQNSVEISDITMDTLTNTEAVNTVTDIGGIAGSSSGVIRNCNNHANVGYQHMGYNIGGVVGTQSGYVVNCKNTGTVQGRKEVGGIIGQLEPASQIEFSEDTLQMLQEQLGTMSGLVNQASGNASSNAAQISDQISLLQDYTENARDAVEALVPDPDKPELPDPDAVLAAENALSTALEAMPNSLTAMASATQATVSGLTRDLNAISNQISAMGETVNNASENLGGSIVDISDQDTAETLTGKAEGCINYGWVLADLNVGGIAGAVAVENDLDVLEDWEQTGDESLNFQSRVRAVVLKCENFGTVTGKKQNAGGITGWQSMGLIKNCTNTGEVDGTGADYVGGISGLSTGYIRTNFSKCVLSGNSYIGGIAGSGTVVTDSLAQVRILEGSEKMGGILGGAEQTFSEEEEPLSRNYCLVVDQDFGAIDGVCYSGMAESMDMNAFLKIENLPNLFRSVMVRFIYDDGRTEAKSVALGNSLRASDIPGVPEKNGYTGAWDGLEEQNLSNILFDMTFQAVYTAYRTSIESYQTRENGLPMLLAEGSFTGKAELTIRESETVPELTREEKLLEAWLIQSSEQMDVLRFQLPADMEVDNLKLLAGSSEGNWRKVPFQQEGRYLVFALEAGEEQIALVKENQNCRIWVVVGVAFDVVVFAGVLIYVRKRSAKRKKTVSQ